MKIQMESTETIPKAPEPTGKRERWQLRVIATGEVVGTYVRRESVEDARHHAQRQPSEYEIIELFPEPTGDDKATHDYERCVGCDNPIQEP